MNNLYYYCSFSQFCGGDFCTKLKLIESLNFLLYYQFEMHFQVCFFMKGVKEKETDSIKERYMYVWTKEENILVEGEVECSHAGVLRGEVME